MKVFVLLASCILLCVEGTYSGPYKGSAARVAAEARQSYIDWSAASNRQDTEGIVDLYTNDATIFPNNRAPIQGRAGLLKFYNDILSAGRWPLNANLVFNKVLENCATKLVVTSYYGRTVAFDGTVGFTVGIRVFRRVRGVLKISQAIWKPIPESEIPSSIDFNQAPVAPSPGHGYYNGYYYS